MLITLYQPSASAVHRQPVTEPDGAGPDRIATRNTRLQLIRLCQRVTQYIPQNRLVSEPHFLLTAEPRGYTYTST